MPYKDTSINLNWNTNVISTAVTNVTRVALTEDMKSVGLGGVVLAFATGECGSENYGGLSPAKLRDANLANFKASGLKFRLSTGGEAGSFSCGSQAGFDAFIAGWVDSGLEGVDFDIEDGQSPDAIAALVDRVKEAMIKYPKLNFSFTVPTFGQGVAGSHSAAPWPHNSAPDPFPPTGYGEKTMNALVAGLGFTKGDPSSWPSNRIRVNPMTMDYGTPNPYICVVSPAGLCDMAQSAIQAAYNLNSYWGVPFSAIELTPMIGDNDTWQELTTPKDATTIAQWARKNGLAGVRYWSYDRDTPCTAAQQPTCNSAPGAGPHAFAKAFLQGVALADAEMAKANKH